jgi:hypothetical protein
LRLVAAVVGLAGSSAATERGLDVVVAYADVGNGIVARRRRIVAVMAR